ncbi:HD domain-containing protein [Candidatus Woesearchaeota archaeon]|nr:HD domain-containing protein [Candidatus Woesearchaeota archaeon]
MKQKIIELLKSTKRKGIDGLIEWMEENEYFTGPASSKPEYHGAHEGGLMEHSYNVYELFKEKNERLKLGLEEDSIIITGLLHDLCKCGIYKKNVLKGGKVSESQPYKVEDSFPLGHGEKSVAIIGQHIKLSNTESLLIRWHMLTYDKEWENYETKVEEAAPAIYAFHCADYESTKYLEKRKK